jgi:hypothetical protein
MATQTSDSAARGYSATKDQLLKRLRRVEGQVRGVQGMVEEDRYPHPRRAGIAMTEPAARPMEHAHDDHHASDQSLNRTAISATLHCLTGCAMLDSMTVLLIPGAMAAGLGDPLFWGSLAGALFIAFWAAVPVNRWLITRGKGHAVVHQYHHAH